MFFVGLLKRSKGGSGVEPPDAAVVPASDDLVVRTLLHAVQAEVFFRVPVLAHQFVALEHPHLVLWRAGEQTMTSAALQHHYPKKQLRTPVV